MCGMVTCRLQGIPGASVEHNNFCVSAHFRNCATENWQRVVMAVNDSVAAQPTQLHVTRGRKVLEVRPQVGMLDLAVARFSKSTVFRYQGEQDPTGWPHTASSVLTDGLLTGHLQLHRSRRLCTSHTKRRQWPWLAAAASSAEG